MLPDNLRRIYRETLAAFNASLPVLTGIGIRAILKAVAKKENAPGEKLEAKVDYLLGDATGRWAVRDAQKDLEKAIGDAKNEATKEQRTAKKKKVDEAKKRLKDVTEQTKRRRDPFVEQTQVLHSLRFMGNAAAHEIMPHAQDELSTALEIVEILLKIFYVLPDKGKTLPTKQ